ncbi:MAG: hypothetical protein GWP17_06455 [Aquificales bacterium]|nr:hypothetical protein [Aquificales bacterium]
MAENQEKTLQVSEQKQVELYGDEVTAVRLSDGQIYVSLSHICKALGVNLSAFFVQIWFRCGSPASPPVK